MRLDIYGLFVVNVMTPRQGWSKGRPVAFVEEGDARREVDLLIPNGLTNGQLESYVAEKFARFARPGRAIRRLDPARLVA